jgi:hypothetical protein
MVMVTYRYFNGLVSPARLYDVMEGRLFLESASRFFLSGTRRGADQLKASSTSGLRI